jgi:hypothetical protein
VHEVWSEPPDNILNVLIIAPKKKIEIVFLVQRKPDGSATAHDALDGAFRLNLVGESPTNN